MKWYVYVIRERGLGVTPAQRERGWSRVPKWNGAVKVGFTKCIERRLAELQTHNPREMKVQHLLGPFSEARARHVERLIQDQWRRHHLTHEWFSPPDTLIERTLQPWL